VKGEDSRKVPHQNFPGTPYIQIEPPDGQGGRQQGSQYDNLIEPQAYQEGQGDLGGGFMPNQIQEVGEKQDPQHGKEEHGGDIKPQNGNKGFWGEYGIPPVNVSRAVSLHLVNKNGS